MEPAYITQEHPAYEAVRNVYAREYARGREPTGKQVRIAVGLASDVIPVSEETYPRPDALILPNRRTRQRTDRYVIRVHRTSRDRGIKLTGMLPRLMQGHPMISNDGITSRDLCIRTLHASLDYLEVPP